MTFDDLVEVTSDINLESLGVYLGKPVDKVDSVSCFQEGKQWVIREITERQRVHERRGLEDDIMRKLYGIIKARM